MGSSVFRCSPRARAVVFALLLYAGALGGAGCATTSSGNSGPVAPPSVNALDYYPLVVGWKWSYEVERDGEKLLAFYSVLERTPSGAVIQAGDERLFYTVTPDGIARKQGEVVIDFLIKSPVVLGTSWPIEGGKATITSVGQEITVDSGKYANCVTVEENRSDPVRVIRTTFAPGVGPVLVEVQVQDGGRFVTATRATLRGVTRPGQDPLAL